MTRHGWQMGLLGLALGSLVGCELPNYGSGPGLVGPDVSQTGDTGTIGDSGSSQDTTGVDAASTDAAEPDIGPGGCLSAAHCGKSQFCAKPQGQCAAIGVCQTMPFGCAADAPVPDPGGGMPMPQPVNVCGCDGKTYSNQCMANANGQSVAHAGPCATETWCKVGEPGGCAPDQYCASSDAGCGSVGKCAARPQGCPAIYAPVCGCDGQTHGNACDAAAAGTGIAYQGECKPTVVECFAYGDMACAPGKYCATAAGQCGGKGVCQDQPQMCPDYAAPVCGCDGQTYANPCNAAAAGVGIASNGACNTGGVCGNGAWGFMKCTNPGEACDLQGCASELPGKCVAMPSACPKLYSPVCGCDGKTYGNDCLRLQAGAAKSYDGACEITSSCTLGDSSTCGKSQFCDIQSCGANQPGICLPPPKAPCPKTMESLQECGCDGITYANACERQLGGIAFDHAGPCGFIGACKTAAGCKAGQGCVNGVCQSCLPKPCAALCAEGWAVDPCTCACYLP